MEPIKSVAIPITRKQNGRKPKSVGHGQPHMDVRIVGAPAPARRVAVTAAPTHIYGIGDRLRLMGGGRRWAREEGFCLVTALLPHEGGPLLYRVRSEVENYERVVAEIDLAPLPEGDLL